MKVSEFKGKVPAYSDTVEARFPALTWSNRRSSFFSRFADMMEYIYNPDLGYMEDWSLRSSVYRPHYDDRTLL